MQHRTPRLLAAFSMGAVLCAAMTTMGCRAGRPDDDGGRADDTVKLGATSSELYVLTPTLWKNPSAIPVCWETAGLATEKAWVADSIKGSWEAATTAVRFTGWDTCTAASKGIRIVVNSFDPDGPHVNGFGLELDGLKNGMTLDLQFSGNTYPTCKSAAMRERCVRSIAIHEFGHAIGFLHEQERGDTPTSCPDRFPVVSAEAKPIGEWDLMSMMNYCYPDRDNVFPTLLSPGDIKGARDMYPPLAPAPAPAPAADGGVGSTSTDPASPSGGAADPGAGDGEDEDEDEDAPKKKTTRASGLTAQNSSGCSAAPVSTGAAGSSLWLIAAVCAAVVSCRRHRERTAPRAR